MWIDFIMDSATIVTYVGKLVQPFMLWKWIADVIRKNIIKKYIDPSLHQSWFLDDDQ